MYGLIHRVDTSARPQLVRQLAGSCRQQLSSCDYGIAGAELEHAVDLQKTFQMDRITYHAMQN